MGLNYTGPLTHRCFSINMCSTINVFSLPCDFKNNISLSLAYFVVGILYVIRKHTKYALIDYVIGKVSGQQLDITS